MRPALATSVLVLVASSAFGAAAESVSLPVAVSASDPLIRYVGRFDRRRPGEAVCAWPGSTVVARFGGAAINVRLRGSKGEDYFEVVVDGARRPMIAMSKDQPSYPVARGLGPGEHTVELVKRTETMSSTTAFLGFDLERGARLVALPPRPERRIEIYGDSVSCGNSCEGTKPDEQMSRRATNNYLAYGAVAARALGAEYACVAWSGRKMWPDSTLAEVFDLTLAPWDGAPKWDFSWVPQAVVINLGSNDYGNGIPDEKLWTDAYVAFIGQVRARYAQCHVFCCLCSTILGKDREPMRRLTKRVVERQRAAGDSKVHYVELPEMGGPGTIGPGWHPTVKMHAAMAEALTKEIRSALKWSASGDSH